METKRDFTNGDHSFKNWFRIMWKNFYIELFLIGIAMTIALIYYKDEFSERDFYISLSIPVAMMIIIAYKGFYQFWKDLKSGRSR